MCVTLGPAQLSDTILYGAVRRVKDQDVHVLGYQNAVQNLYNPSAGRKRSGFTWNDVMGGTPERPLTSGNAMILPIPAVPGSMTPENALDTENCPNILKDMALALEPRRRGVATLGISAKSAPDVQVFDHGIYTVVLANTKGADCYQIMAALQSVPAEKRPDMGQEIVEVYTNWYSGWTIAFCCFNTRRKTLAAPLLWWYRPMFPGFLFLPALDAHDGGIPDLKAQVTRDHTLVVGSSKGTPVDYQDFEAYRGRQPANAPVREYLADKVIGGRFMGGYSNGDWLVEVVDAERGVFEPQLLPPPGA